MSSINTSRPMLAKWQAMPEPMTPEPSTAAFLILLLIGYRISFMVNVGWKCIVVPKQPSLELG